MIGSVLFLLSRQSLNGGRAVLAGSGAVLGHGRQGVIMNTRMLVPLVLVAGLMHGQQASATVLPYGNNPFKFCSEGMPSDGWVPVDWRTGT